AKDRLIKNARFAQIYGMDPTVNHTGHFIIEDFPSPGQYFHTGLGPGIALEAFYTVTMVDILVRGYYLTGDTALLERAKYQWDRSSRAIDTSSYPYTAR